jgi:hypothetical protein
MLNANKYLEVFENNYIFVNEVIKYLNKNKLTNINL